MRRRDVTLCPFVWICSNLTQKITEFREAEFGIAQGSIMDFLSSLATYMNPEFKKKVRNISLYNYVIQQIP